MNRLPRWKPRLALLVGICGVSAAGICVPKDYTDPLRTAVADALRPGRVAAMAAAGAAQSAIDRFRAPDGDDELEQLKAELAVWQRRSLRETADAIGPVRQASAEIAADVPAELRSTAPPLLVTGLVPAQVLGREPDVLKARFGRILNRGASSSVAVDDLVLADAPHVHLDQGAAAGVESGQPVISGRIVVGSIRQAGQWTSTLQLVTDPEYRANVQLVRESRQGLMLGPAGVLRGNGDGTCRMELVPNKAAVSIGDFVFSRQADAESPAPLYFGRVIAADAPAGKDEWSITVAPGFDAAALPAVQILTVSLNPERVPSSGTPPQAAPADNPGGGTALSAAEERN